MQTARPILFSGPMVRALRADDKNQTRRMIKPQPKHREGPDGVEWWTGFMGWQHIESCLANPLLKAHVCPYGKPGDLLWVRETFSGPYYLHDQPPVQWPEPWSWEPGAYTPPIWYWADGNPEDGDWTRPKPSIHMPRWASRITLEITNVRAERLQAISDTDCFAEGIGSQGECEFYNRAEHFSLGGSPVEGGSIEKCAFIGLWCSINGRESWDANPWVWVVEFNAYEKNIEQYLKEKASA